VNALGRIVELLEMGAGGAHEHVHLLRQPLELNSESPAVWNDARVAKNVVSVQCPQRTMRSATTYCPGSRSRSLAAAARMRASSASGFMRSA